jgi:hypothetical protein
VAIELTMRVWNARGLSPMEKLVLLRIADRVNRQTGVAFPGVRSIARDCGLSKQGTLNILDRLIERSVLEVVAEGSGTRARTYRVNVAQLASGQGDGPQADSDLTPSGQPNGPQGAGVDDEIEGVAVHSVQVAVNAMNDSGQQGGPKSEGTVIQPEEDHRPAGGPAFKVYAAIASRAIDTSLRVDRSDDVSNISEHFKRACVEDRLPYDGDIARKAIDAALHAREKKKREFNEALDRFRPKRAMR